MLNVAVIRSVAYYLDQVAHSRADYYVGRGEARGRWRGGLAASFGLTGTVDPDHLRALLEGRNPQTGDTFLPNRVGAGKPPAARAAQGTATMSVDAAADAIGVSSRTVRRWAATGSTAWSEAEAATPNASSLSTPRDVLAR
ncbi:MAG TPA: relaxase domain-containing protein, partial [Acidimicrobiia bacterium]|nr:relaxase domain-containing protein [Acidimicrobiia bacterium]